MTTRERALILAMAGAALWGGATLGIDQLKKHRGEAQVNLQKAEIRRFAEVQRGIVAPLRLSGPERMMLDEAAAPWAESPFFDRVAVARPVEEPVETFLYTGFIQVGSRQFAILNGREYRVSEPVAETDFRVDAIHPDHVVLVSGSGGRRMTIALQTTNEKRKSP